ncbi:peroxiredoxin [Defluviimonas sp. D31]|uniref:peroxiredoxin n=1 Tax=Defluviimonas sp. D31 TaxID=3083253 RepID=UPI00296F43A0|nr:peroxiredoxin [Defluviimonas sp. D31]MDW4551294.1 peroxiredoxin [Defluviimonas sp. D31]
MIATGGRLPEAELLRIGAGGPETVRLSERLAGRKVVLFAVPGAFTPTCDSAHLPGFIRSAPALRARGVEEIICVSVNDAHVMRYWGETTGATAAGITLLADADGAFSRALGLTYDNPAAGMFGRSRRYAMVVEDGVVTAFELDPIGQCSLSTGEALLEKL